MEASEEGQSDDQLDIRSISDEALISMSVSELMERIEKMGISKERAMEISGNELSFTEKQRKISEDIPEWIKV